MGKVILGGLLGGAVVFMWGYVSWMVLPWHQWTFQKFKSETAVEALVSTAVDEDGLYLLPNARVDDPDLSAEEKQTLQQQAQENMQSGPVVFAAIRRGESRPMGQMMGISFAGNFFAAALISWLLLRSACHTWMSRVQFVKTIAFTALVIRLLPEWNWWGFSNTYCLVEALDTMIAWGLAGSVLALILRPAK